MFGKRKKPSVEEIARDTAAMKAQLSALREYGKAQGWLQLVEDKPTADTVGVVVWVTPSGTILAASYDEAGPYLVIDDAKTWELARQLPRME